MKQFQKALLCIFVCSLIAISCKKEHQPDASPQQESISAEVIARIKNEGFSAKQVQKVKGGYVVEGDIFLSDKWLAQKGNSTKLRIGKTEQYKTTNLLTINGNREVTVSIENLPAAYTAALDDALARYNALGMNLTFRRVADGGEIRIINEWLGDRVWGRSGGFPTADGNLASDPIKLSAALLGANPFQGFLTSVIAHEIGHCIGLRHTDYFNRTFSCGIEPGINPNEGENSEGAIQIPGTPSAEDANSFMLACIDSWMDRPFNANDVIALRYLYGGVRPIPDGVYRIMAMHSGKVLDVYDASTDDLVPVIQYPWNGDDNQRWQFTFLDNGYYRIEALHSWKAITLFRSGPFGTGNLRLVQLNWSNSTTQQWKVSVVQPGQFAIESRFNGLVWDVFDASQDDGVDIITWPWNGDGNQRWELTGL